MTVIAYRDGILAADTLVCRGSEKDLGAAKLFETKKFMVGISGAFSNLHAFKHWLETAECHEMGGGDAENFHIYWEEAPCYGEGFSYLMIDENQRIFTGTNHPPLQVNKSCYAIGSGSDFAAGAMAFGASAVEAVAVAISLDIYSGGDIRTISKEDVFK